MNIFPRQIPKLYFTPEAGVADVTARNLPGAMSSFNRPVDFDLDAGELVAPEIACFNRSCRLLVTYSFVIQRFYGELIKNLSELKATLATALDELPVPDIFNYLCPDGRPEGIGKDF